MRGKIGLVVGLAAGYVLGSRAGRERYDQIKAQALKVWNLEPVQAQVTKAQDFGKTALMALPRAVWNGAVKVGKAATGGTPAQTPGERLDAALAAGKDSADDVAAAAETSAKAAEASVKKAATAAKRAASERDGE